MTTYIVAEIGINHGGNYDVARDLVDAAAEAGADAVKFQCFWHRWPSEDKWELRTHEFKKLFRQAEHLNIDWFATPFGTVEMQFLKDEGMIKWKIPSGHATNKQFLEDIAKYAGQDSEFILSTGMCSLVDIDVALACLGYGLSLSNKITILHCTSCYPTKPEEVNLNVIPFLRSLKGLPVGLSDHTTSPLTAIAAVALGAVMIEKHLTLDCDQVGPDHKASLDQAGFRKMVGGIRYIEHALGERIKKPTPGELKVMDGIRKSMMESYS